MKKQMNRLFLGMIPLILVSIAFGSCESEKEFSHSEKMIVRRCSLKDLDLQSNIQLNEAVNNFRRIQSGLDSSNRIIYNDHFDLYFDDEKGVYMSKDGKESYTFPIIQADTNEKIKNITFNKNKDNGYDVYIVTYDFNKEDVQNYPKEILAEREAEYQVLIKNGVEYPIEEMRMVCVRTVTTITNVEFHENEGAGGLYFVCVTITETVECTSTGVGGGGGSGGGSGSSSGNGSGGLGGSGGSGGGGGSGSGNNNPIPTSPDPVVPPTNPNPSGPIITGPVIDTDFEGQTPEKTPCEILKEQVDNNPDFETKIDSLKQRVLSTNVNPDTHETTISVKKNGDLLTYSASNNSMSSNGLTIGSSNMTNRDIAILHNHPINTVPIFSHKDIVDLYEAYNFVIQPRKEEYTSYLTCFNGATYALRIENINVLMQLFQGLNFNTAKGRADAEDRVLNIFKAKGFNINQDYTEAMAEDLFADVMNDILLGGGTGVNIYKKDETGWGKLTRGSNGIVQKENCN